MKSTKFLKRNHIISSNYIFKLKTIIYLSLKYREKNIKTWKNQHQTPPPPLTAITQRRADWEPSLSRLLTTQKPPSMPPQDLEEFSSSLFLPKSPCPTPWRALICQGSHPPLRYCFRSHPIRVPVPTPLYTPDQYYHHVRIFGIRKSFSFIHLYQDWEL